MLKNKNIHGDIQVGKKYSKKEGDRALFLKRNDTEFCEYDFGAHITEESAMLDTCDWPTMDRNYKTTDFMYKLMRKKRTTALLSV